MPSIVHVHADDPRGGTAPCSAWTAEAARQLYRQADPQATMDTAVRLAATHVRGCDAAAISLVERRGRLFTAAYTDDVAIGGDLLQYALKAGPCLDAVWAEQVVHSPDLAKEARWPVWAHRMAHDHGVNSMLCLRLFTDTETLGALNLYGRRRRGFDPHDRDNLTLAADTAVALAAAQRGEQLTRALDTRAVIGQACGILMERYDLDPEQAFSVLVRVSSESDLKLRAVARQLVDTRRLPGRVGVEPGASGTGPAR